MSTGLSISFFFTLKQFPNDIESVVTLLSTDQKIFVDLILLQTIFDHAAKFFIEPTYYQEHFFFYQQIVQDKTLLLKSSEIFVETDALSFFLKAVKESTTC